MKRTETHVMPRAEGGWEVVRPGSRKSESLHPTQKEAEHRARELLRVIGGGELVIHGKDGRIRESDAVPSSGESKKPVPSR